MRDDSEIEPVALTRPPLPSPIFLRSKREKWIRDWAGQTTLTSGQIAWTVECTKALYATSEGHKSAMRQAKKKQVSSTPHSLLSPH